MNTCRSCELPIKPEDEQAGCAPGIHYHQICYRLGVTSLTCDLDAFFRDHPEEYEQLPNGKFIERR